MGPAVDHALHAGHRFDAVDHAREQLGIAGQLRRRARGRELAAGLTATQWPAPNFADIVWSVRAMMSSIMIRLGVLSFGLGLLGDLRNAVIGGECQDAPILAHFLVEVREESSRAVSSSRISTSRISWLRGPKSWPTTSRAEKLIAR